MSATTSKKAGTGQQKTGNVEECKKNARFEQDKLIGNKCLS